MKEEEMKINPFHGDEVTFSRTKAIQTTIIGTIASEMGYANVSKVCRSGEEVFQYLGRLTYKEFSNIKKLLKANKNGNKQKRDNKN